MYCTGQYFEKPWNRVDRPAVKTEAYFHSKDDRWNSLSHSSPKQAGFFLTAQSGSLYLSASQPPAVLKDPAVPQRSVVSQNRLTRRTLEREMLQLKSNQRRLISGPSDPPVDHCDRFTDYKDPSHSPVTDGSGAWNKLNEQPVKRVRMTVTRKVVELDREAVRALDAAVARDREQEAWKLAWLMQNRRRMHSTMTQRKTANQELESRAGLRKVKPLESIQSPAVSDRLQQLSLPRQTRELHLPSDYRGLLLLDYADATETAYRNAPRLATSKSTRSNLKFFPLPETLGIGSRSVLDSRPEIAPRPDTVKTENRLIVPKPKDTIGDEMMSRAEVLESLKEIDDFNNRAHKEETVAFSKIHFSTFKDGSNKPR